MQFKYRRIGIEAQEQLALIMRNQHIGVALKHGGYIAGGFSRWLALGKLPFDYLDVKSRFGELPQKGDIDIFFPSHNAAAAAVSEFHGSRESFAKFARESTIDVGSNVARVQFVNHPDMIHGDPDRCVESFDFKNCATWVHGMGVMVPDGWEELERERLLEIMSAKSPFLGSRIKKYIRRHGFLGITESSREHVKAWMLKAARVEFGETFSSNHTCGVHSALKSLVSKHGLVSSEDLTIIIGAVMTTLPDPEFYGDQVQVDLAVHELSRRQKQQEIEKLRVPA